MVIPHWLVPSSAVLRCSLLELFLRPGYIFVCKPCKLLLWELIDLRSSYRGCSKSRYFCCNDPRLWVVCGLFVGCWINPERSTPLGPEVRFEWVSSYFIQICLLWAYWGTNLGAQSSSLIASDDRRSGGLIKEWRRHDWFEYSMI